LIRSNGSFSCRYSRFSKYIAVEIKISQKITTHINYSIFHLLQMSVRWEMNNIFLCSSTQENQKSQVRKMRPTNIFISSHLSFVKDFIKVFHHCTLVMRWRIVLRCISDRATSAYTLSNINADNTRELSSLLIRKILVKTNVIVIILKSSWG